MKIKNPGADEGEFPWLPKARGIKPKKPKQDQIGGQGLSSRFEVPETSSNSNVA